MLPIHLRMARAALDWTLKDLAERAGVNVNTISRYEAGSEILTGTMQKIEGVLRNEGIIFVDDDAEFGPSIRIRKQLQAPHAEDTNPHKLRTIKRGRPRKKR